MADNMLCLFCSFSVILCDLILLLDQPQNIDDVASVRVELHHDTADVWGS